MQRFHAGVSSETAMVFAASISLILYSVSWVSIQTAGLVGYLPVASSNGDIAHVRGWPSHLYSALSLAIHDALLGMKSSASLQPELHVIAIPLLVWEFVPGPGSSFPYQVMRSSLPSIWLGSTRPLCRSEHGNVSQLIGVSLYSPATSGVLQSFC